MPDWSPYNYAFNNPIKFIDPDGMAPESTDCDGCKGFILTVVDNFFGSNLRNDFASDSQNYQNGVTLGHNTSLAAGQFLMGDGALNIGAGTAGLAGSAVVSATGVGAIVGAPAAASSATLIGKGVTEVAVGAHIVSMTGKNITNDNNKNDLAKEGRKGKQARLRELANDPKVSRADRGWIKNELRHIKNNNRRTIRNPRNSRRSKERGTELKHPHDKRAKDGHDYSTTKFQDADLHKLEHKHHGYK